MYIVVLMLVIMLLSSFLLWKQIAESHLFLVPLVIYVLDKASHNQYYFCKIYHSLLLLLHDNLLMKDVKLNARHFSCYSENYSQQTLPGAAPSHFSTAGPFSKRDHNLFDCNLFCMVRCRIFRPRSAP